MKKGILIRAMGGDNWIGGLYYARNIVFQLTQNNEILEKYNIWVYTSEKYRTLFSGLHDRIKIITPKNCNNKINIVDLILKIITYKIEYIFPMDSSHNVPFIHSIAWIPDFQHKHFPEFFCEQERAKRDIRFIKLYKSNTPIILSSEDSKRDFEKYYGKRNKVYVVHFVSYIEDLIEQINEKKEKEILEKYNLQGTKYICVMNQFWEHKNHITVLKALLLFYRKNPNSEMKVIFTGQLQKDTSSEYVSRIQSILADDILANRVYVLGFIDRLEQILILKNSEYLIQPSLFEGWGTVLEDAKVLDKTVVLSDISVHREQMYNKCMLFDPYNEKELAELIEQENKKTHIDNLNEGIRNMYKYAKEYSKVFRNLLDDMEK